MADHQNSVPLGGSPHPHTNHAHFSEEEKKAKRKSSVGSPKSKSIKSGRSQSPSHKTLTEVKTPRKSVHKPHAPHPPEVIVTSATPSSSVITGEAGVTQTVAPPQLTFTGTAALGARGLILLTLAVALGLAALVLIVAMYNKATYYQPECLTANEYRGSRNVSCEELTPGSYDECHMLQRRHDEDIHLSTHTRPECPSKWMIVPFMYLQFFAWVGSLGCLIVVAMLGSTNPLMFKIGGYVTMGVAGLLFLSALLYLNFFLWLVSSNAWCSRKAYYFMAGHEADFKEGICGGINKKRYEPWILLSGSITTGLSGILFVVAGTVMVAVGMSRVAAEETLGIKRQILEEDDWRIPRRSTLSRDVTIILEQKTVH